MSDANERIERAMPAVIERAREVQGPARLELDAVNPLVTLPPDIVALIVARVRAGASAFGDDYPNGAVRKRVVVPSLSLAVVDAVGLVAAVAAERTLLAITAGILLVVLASLGIVGITVVRRDPLRVTGRQRAQVAAAKRWRPSQPWTNTERDSPQAHLVDVAAQGAADIVRSDAWAWVSLAQLRAGVELADVLDELDAAAFADRPSPNPSDTLARRVAALRCCADVLAEISTGSGDIRTALPARTHETVSALLASAQGRNVLDSEPS